MCIRDSEYPVVMAMKGVGKSLGPQLMAEIGDVSRFTHKGADVYKRQQSASPTPWKAPAMKGLSSTALQNTTSFAQPMHSLSFVSSAVLWKMCIRDRLCPVLWGGFSSL